MAGILLGAPEGSEYWRKIDLRDNDQAVDSYRLIRGLARETAQASIAMWKERFPDATLRSFSSVYNCVGMVFASRRAWIESTDLGRILQHDGYSRLGGPQEAGSGDLVLYRGHAGEYSHVAVVLWRYPTEGKAELGIMALSKWGKEGEYIHKAESVPVHCGNPREYWSEKAVVR